MQPPIIRKKSSDSERILLFLQSTEGDLSEWLKEHAWKACKRETVSRVRIPQSPPDELKTHEFSWVFCYPNERSSLQRVWITKRPAAKPLGF